MTVEQDIVEIKRILDQVRAIETLLYSPVTAYTPTYTGSVTAGTTTYSVQSGFWVRINAVVIVQGRVVWTAATGTGNARISLPVAAGAYEYGSGALWTDGVTFANGPPQIQLPPNVAFFEMISPLTNAASAAVAMEAAGNIGFTVVYFV